MATNKELEVQVKQLNQKVTRLQTSNSQLRDELVVIKGHYTKLVNEMSERLEVIHKTFRNKK